MHGGSGDTMANPERPCLFSSDVLSQEQQRNVKADIAPYWKVQGQLTARCSARGALWFQTAFRKKLSANFTQAYKDVDYKEGLQSGGHAFHNILH